MSEHKSYSGLLIAGDIHLGESAPGLRIDEDFPGTVEKKLDFLFSYARGNNLRVVLAGKLCARAFSVAVLGRWIALLLGQDAVYAPGKADLRANGQINPHTIPALLAAAGVISMLDVDLDKSSETGAVISRCPISQLLNARAQGDLIVCGDGDMNGRSLAGLSTSSADTIACRARHLQGQMRGGDCIGVTALVRIDPSDPPPLLWHWQNARAMPVSVPHEAHVLDEIAPQFASNTIGETKSEFTNLLREEARRCAALTESDTQFVERELQSIVSASSCGEHGRDVLLELLRSTKTSECDDVFEGVI